MIRIGNINEMHCTGCKSKDLERIKRPALIKFLSFGAPIKHYQCSKCRKTCYILTKKSAKHTIA